MLPAYPIGYCTLRGSRSSVESLELREAETPRLRHGGVETFIKRSRPGPKKINEADYTPQLVGRRPVC
jgi:hypothetical protein